MVVVSVLELVWLNNFEMDLYFVCVGWMIMFDQVDKVFLLLCRGFEYNLLDIMDKLLYY